MAAVKKPPVRIYLDAEAKVWAKFAAAAIEMSDSDSVRECAKEAAEFADAMLMEYRKRTT
jgi:hypothetical protein